MSETSSLGEFSLHRFASVKLLLEHMSELVGSSMLRGNPGRSVRRLRNGGSQTVRVEHVHVNEDGQAVIGNVK